MSVQHKDLPNAELHEPKGVSGASADTVYVADGAGSGDWKVQPTSAYGSMEITNNTTPVSVTAAGDTTLHTSGDFIKVATNWTAGNVLTNMSFVTDHLRIDRAGIYHIISYVTVKSDTANIQVGIKYAINDTTFTARTPQHRLSTADVLYNIAGNGFIDTLSVNDEISLYIAANKTANITVNDAKVALILLEV